MSLKLKLTVKANNFYNSFSCLLRDNVNYISGWRPSIKSSVSSYSRLNFLVVIQRYLNCGVEYLNSFLKALIICLPSLCQITYMQKGHYIYSI